MNLVRYLADGRAHPGAVEGSTVYAISGNGYPDLTIGAPVGPLGQVRLLAPCVPTKIIAVGLNYRDPAREGQQPLPDEPIFGLKPPSSVIGPDQPIVWPLASQRIDFEGELAIVIGRMAKGLTPSEAERAILGITCANDVTARDVQRREGQWSKAKGFDTFCPLGPWIATDVDPATCQLVVRVNGVVRQSVATSLLHFPPAVLVSYLSRVMTLLPGDVILTGTPPGYGPLRAGDVVEVELSGVGTLRNPVVTESASAASGGEAAGGI